MILNTNNMSYKPAADDSSDLFQTGQLLTYLPSLVPTTRPFYTWKAPVSVSKLDLRVPEHRNYLSAIGAKLLLWPGKDTTFLYLGGKAWQAGTNNTVVHFFIMTNGHSQNKPNAPVVETPTVVYRINDGWELPMMMPLRENIFGANK